MTLIFCFVRAVRCVRGAGFRTSSFFWKTTMVAAKLTDAVKDVAVAQGASMTTFTLTKGSGATKGVSFDNGVGPTGDKGVDGTNGTNGTNGTDGRSALLGTELNFPNTCKIWTSGNNTLNLGPDGTTRSNSMALGNGTIDFGDPTATYLGYLHVYGNLSKTSGTFRIPHPLPRLRNTHHLVHSFTESPFADLVYSGSSDLVHGACTVDIDTESHMTAGTFEVLTHNWRFFCQNVSGFTPLRCELRGSKLSVVAADSNCRDQFLWQVVGERCDEDIKRSKLTDSDGRVIVEPLTPQLPQVSRV